ncbi:MAG: hypothetical protein NC131_10610 [Roseburia sp.]|nr:hypothetical protein [Roseburia sp.]
MGNRRIVFNNMLCDGSSHCWFLKENESHERNCPAQVFTYNSAQEVTKRLIANIEACVGCEHCDGHCPAARLAVDEERDICMAALKDLEAELGVKTSDGLFTEPVHNPELNIYVKDVDVTVGVQKTLDLLSNFHDRLQLIELFDSAICAIASLPYNEFYNIIEAALANQIYPYGIDRRVIYTHDDKLAVKEFIRAFNIDSALYESLPLLIIYFNGKVLAVWGHGEVGLGNFYKFSNGLALEITNQLRKNNTYDN